MHCITKIFCCLRLIVLIIYLHQESRQRPVKSGGDNEDLFDEVLKKSQVYSQKYNTGAGLNKNGANIKNLDQNFRLSISSEKRNNTSAKSDLSVSVSFV